MPNFVRIAAYTFLALSGLYAWQAYETGWRPVAGLVLAVIATARIFSFIRPSVFSSKSPPKPSEKPHSDDS